MSYLEELAQGLRRFLSRQPQGSGVAGDWHRNFRDAGEDTAGFFGQTPGGAATINPLMMAQGYRAALSRYHALVRLGLIDELGHLVTRDNQIPNRRMLTNEGLNMSGAGVVMPATRIPNAYRGPQPQGVSPDEALGQINNRQQWLTSI